MEVTSRKEARERGLKKYFTGKPCSKGHVAERYVSGPCTICAYESGVKWKRKNPEAAKASKAKTYHAYREKINAKRREEYKANPEPHIERARKFREGNREKMSGIRKRSYERHADKRRKEARDWSRENRDRVNEIKRRHYQDNKEVFAAQFHRRRDAERRGKLKPYGELDALCFAEAYQQCRDMENLTGFPWAIDHVIPLRAESASGLNSFTNLQVLPAHLNASKCNRMMYLEPYEFLKDVT